MPAPAKPKIYHIVHVDRLASIIADEVFYDLDGPIVRITTPHIPLPAADALEPNPSSEPAAADVDPHQQEGSLDLR